MLWNNKNFKSTIIIINNKCYEVGAVEFVDVIIAVLLSMLVSIFSLSTFPVLSDGDNSWPPAPARKRTHFFFRLKEKAVCINPFTPKVNYEDKYCNVVLTLESEDKIVQC